MRAKGERERSVTGAELLGDEGDRERVESGAAELAGDAEAEQADPRKLGNDLAREPSRLVPRQGLRDDALADERPYRIADRDLIVAVAEVQD